MSSILSERLNICISLAAELRINFTSLLHASTPAPYNRANVNKCVNKYSITGLGYVFSLYMDMFTDMSQVAASP